MRKTALITGITGQDGSYLAELLLEKGYDVHGIIRRSSSFNTSRIDHIYDQINLHYGDLLDASNLAAVISRIRPDEIYNLAAQSHVKVSFEMPEYTGETTGLGTMRMLEAIRTCGMEKTCRFYQASSSELYGKVHEIPQTELTPFYPRSPYGVAKLYAFWAVKNYRESYGMFACNGILFNHESPRRGGTFVTKKITAAVARIAAGKLDRLELGNLDSKRDWGHARDFVKAQWMMLQQDTPDDFVISTGVECSVREFTDMCFKIAGYEIEWKGKDENEVGIDKATGEILVAVNPKYYRPCEVETLLGDCSKAKKQMCVNTKDGQEFWYPSIALNELAYDMLFYDFSVHNVDLPNDAKERGNVREDFQPTCINELAERKRCLRGSDGDISTRKSKSSVNPEFAQSEARAVA